MKELITEFEIASANIVKGFIKNIFGKNIDDYTTEQIKELFVGNEITGIIEYNDYFINFGDMYLVINYDVSEVDFMEWYDYNLKWSLLDSNHSINLHSWIHGCPRRTYTEYINAKAKYNLLQDYKAEFENYIAELNENK